MAERPQVQPDEYSEIGVINLMRCSHLYSYCLQLDSLEDEICSLIILF